MGTPPADSLPRERRRRLAEGGRMINFPHSPKSHQFASQSAISRNQPYHATLARARFGTVSCIQPEWNLLVTSGIGIVGGGS